VRLSVVVPVYNERASIGGTVRRLGEAVRKTSFELDLVVVDDGSSDGSGAEAAAAAEPLGGRVLRQENRGRFAARRAGLGAAQGELVLFLDSRVLLAEGALRFVEERVGQGERVWNGHVHIDASTAVGRFWNVLTELAFAQYFSDPRTTSFDAESFDRFPKGMGCFLAPAALLREAFARHSATYYSDERNANDDTPVIRWIAERERIHISPSFACAYAPHSTLRGFVKHAAHRGVVFLDGHGRRASRFFPIVVAFYPASLALVVLAVLVPWTGAAAVVLVAALAAAVALVRRRSRAEVVAFGLLAPVYALAHGFGMWRGAFLAVGGRR
jgi:glycosyltransferase involved in cell wall biosynthesis